MKGYVWRHALPSDVKQRRVIKGLCGLNTDKRDFEITFRLNLSKTVGKLTQ